MRNAIVWAMLSTIITLNAILFLGTLEHDSPLNHLILDSLVPMFDAWMLVSSGLLGVRFWRQRRRWLSGLFGLNILIFAGAVIWRSSGLHFPRWLLFGADLYWLHLYLIVLVKEFVPSS